MTSSTVYRGLLRLYPREFRREYGEDMSQLLALQLRDESTLRVWGRTLLDLALTLPSQRLESVMSRRPALPVAFYLYGAAAVLSLVMTAVSGTAVGVGSAGLLLAAGFASLAVLAWRRAHALAAGSPVSLHWWRFLAAGSAGLAGCVLAAAVAGELPERTWLVWVVALLASLVATAVGVCLGVLHAVDTRRAASS